ncbi:uncharacterized protein METZ01_LOCUS95067 [marine metagenome]|uniref:Uncharacterized protein n=1 Tax=marine metagenome TaxID=408172 RepID=A0A381VRP4_9ZZZZ
MPDIDLSYDLFAWLILYLCQFY